MSNLLQPPITFEEDEGYYIMIVTVPKGFLKQFNENTSSTSDEVLIHSLCGNGIEVAIVKNSKHGFIFEFDDPEIKELLVKMLKYWTNVREKKDDVKFMDHEEKRWRQSYEHHAGKVLMTQQNKNARTERSQAKYSS